MDQEKLINQWNQMRSQIINAQMAPSLVLVGVVIAATFGKFEGASDATKYATLGIVAVTGILAIISQYAAVREGEALLADLAKVSSPSNLAKVIASSRGLLSLSAIAIVGSGLAIFALVVWMVLA
ncbi:hypothetical protein B1s21160_01885 [Candidatus Nanopelagicus hibericus]|uniref:Uncharacterized protein n=1 Tax=Candidatus Nanopelagicus hibericus TaxID=1884915 RepID=A0A249KAU4_9ACTN|nr:hypothetical protein [Candidatus Nanopelagicus hibericus]ASY13917.1 hypothetical protein B1s21160_01885 [Candidatus Nanopelagicus hibericus]